MITLVIPVLTGTLLCPPGYHKLIAVHARLVPDALNDIRTVVMDRKITVLYATMIRRSFMQPINQGTFGSRRKWKNIIWKELVDLQTEINKKLN